MNKITYNYCSGRVSNTTRLPNSLLGRSSLNEPASRNSVRDATAASGVRMYYAKLPARHCSYYELEARPPIAKIPIYYRRQHILHWFTEANYRFGDAEFYDVICTALIIYTEILSNRIRFILLKNYFDVDFHSSSKVLIYDHFTRTSIPILVA